MSVSDTLINTLFDGRYRILRKLGSGGMANVYLAEDEDLGRRIAIKILNDRYAQDELFNERFRREAQSAAGLSHPNIVSIYDRGEADGIPYIAMEVIEGRSLKELILTRGRLPIAQAISYAQQILSALRFAHRNGIIHRDIKPHNILVGAEDRLKVTDFGIARAGASQMTEAGSIMGTAQYLSPEQARGAPVAAASDLYSAGIVLYEMLTGQVPFTGDSPIEIAMKHLNEAPRPPSVHRPEIPPELDQIVLRSLAKNAEERYQRAEDFAEDLQRVEAGIPVSPETTAAATAILSGMPTSAATQVLAPDAAVRSLPPEAPAAPPRHPRPPRYSYEEPPPKKGRRWAPWLLVLLLLSAAALAGWYVFTRIQDELAANEPVGVPLVEGLREARAIQVLEDRGLEANVEEQPTTEEPPGIVFDQDPNEGTRIAKGEAVTIFVSTGPPKTDVPRVVGLSFTEAIQVLDDQNLEWERRDVFSAKPVDQVVRQNPKAGGQVEEGSTVILSVSKGKKTVAVPDVLFQSQESAVAELQAEGFDVSVVEVESDQDEGLVVNQSPAPGAEAAEGSTVQIFVSQGPQTQEVPNVVGDDRQSARQTLRQAGFKVVVQEEATDDPTQDGLVVDQDPTGGTQAEPGSTVTIVVAQFEGGP
jgi:eukaryotic-like serine/threonine-protein kinase